MKFSKIIALGAISILTQQVSAQTITVDITNLTHGSYFTPLFVSAHPAGTDFFEIGEASSAAIQAMAEGGSIDGLVAEANPLGAVTSEDPAGGLLNPGASTVVMDLDTGTNNLLTIAAMILPSNDAFIGLDSWNIPSEAGVYTLYLNAYDAGTEANDEIVNGGGASGVAGIPANPGGNGGVDGTGVTTTESNNNVHIHRGVIGDTDPAGGPSDLDSRIHRWLNPVAKVVVTVQ